MKMKTGSTIVGISLLVVIQLAAAFPSLTEVEEVPSKTAEVERLDKSGGVVHENAEIVSAATGAEKPNELQSNPSNEVQASEQSDPSPLINKPHKTTLLTSVYSGSSSDTISSNSAHKRPLGNSGGSGLMSRPLGSSPSVNQFFRQGAFKNRAQNRPSLFANSNNKQSALPSGSNVGGNNENPLVQPIQASSSQVHQWKLGLLK